ncbi:MAG: BMC domain-containing protein [Sarcina sp.]
MNALGILEVFGLTTALVAADALCKAGDVKIEAFDKNKPANAENLSVPLLVTIKFKGNISDVKMAMEAGEKAAKSISGINVKSIIANVDSGIKSLIKESCIK